jgi:hypothetical protein
MHPLALGFLHVSSGVVKAEISTWRKALTDFANCEGFALTDIYMEYAEGAMSGFASLVEAARRRRVSAVVIPGLNHFASLPSVQIAMKRLLVEQTGVQLFVLSDFRPDRQRRFA